MSIIRHTKHAEVDTQSPWAISVKVRKLRANSKPQSCSKDSYSWHETRPCQPHPTWNDPRCSLETLFLCTSILLLSFPSIHLSSSTSPFSLADVSRWGWGVLYVWSWCQSGLMPAPSLSLTQFEKGGMYHEIEPGARKSNGCIPPSDIYLHCLSHFPSLVLSLSRSSFLFCH